MTAPTAPYLTNDLLVGLQQNLLKGGTEFNSDTAIIDTNVDQYILWISSEIDQRFLEAGYKIPFLELSGETWPTHQTLFLQSLTGLGVSSMMALSLKPAPAVGPGYKGAAINEYELRYKTALDRIYNGKKAMPWRAQFYLGTAAEKAVTEPRRPMSDWMEGYKDKTKYMDLTEYTDLMRIINAGIINDVDKWDYMYDLLNIGYGY